MKKKAFFATLALTLGLCLASCSQNGAQTKSDEQTTTQDSTATENVAEAQNDNGMPTDMAALLQKVKDESANYTVDQWKDVFNAVFKAGLPTAKALKEMTQLMDTNPSEGIAKMQEIQKEHPEYEEIGRMMHEIESIAEKTENGKKVIKDDDFIKKAKAAIGFPEEI